MLKIHRKQGIILINIRGSTSLKHFNESKTFIGYSNDMDDIYKNIEEYIPIKKREILIAFDDMIADMLSNKNLNLIVTELIVFITQSYFAVPKNIRLNSTHCSTMKNSKHTRISSNCIQSFIRY